MLARGVTPPVAEGSAERITLGDSARANLDGTFHFETMRPLTDWNVGIEIEEASSQRAEADQCHCAGISRR